MNKKICLICFSFTKVVRDIKFSYLQRVYEELTDIKIQNDSFLLCYICYEKLLQCELLIKTAQQHKTENQTQVRSLVQLCIENDSWLLPNNLNEYGIELQANISKHSERKQKYVESSLSSELDIKEECIKEEVTESLYQDEVTVEPPEDKHISIEQKQDDDHSYKCNVCNKKFSFRSKLKAHERIHTGDKPYACNKCDKKFNLQGNLRKHLHNIHYNDKPFSCDVCSKKFPYPSFLKAHKCVHTGVKYACEKCDKKFNMLCHLQKHQHIHLDEKPFPCDVCSKRFCRLFTLKRHQLTHAVNKVYSCDVCSKSFFENYSLKRHELIHTGVKPYSCDVCNKSFRQSGTLKRHKMVRVH